jgi:hypothetical protein
MAPNHNIEQSYLCTPGGTRGFMSVGTTVDKLDGTVAAAFETTETGQNNSASFSLNDNMKIQNVGNETDSLLMGHVRGRDMAVICGSWDTAIGAVAMEMLVPVSHWSPSLQLPALKGFNQGKPKIVVLTSSQVNVTFQLGDLNFETFSIDGLTSFVATLKKENQDVMTIDASGPIQGHLLITEQDAVLSMTMIPAVGFTKPYAAFSGPGLEPENLNAFHVFGEGEFHHQGDNVEN